MGEQTEINLADVFQLLLSKIKIIILVTVLCGAAGYCYARYVLPPQYTSTIKMYVTVPTKVVDSETGEVTEKTNLDQTVSRNLAATCIVILDDNSVYEQIGRMLIADYDLDDLKNYFTITTDDNGDPFISAEQIKGLISVTAIDNTEVLQVTCTTPVPKFSADICTYISKIAPELLIRTMKAGSVETVSAAEVPKGPSGPNVKRFALIGALAGMVLVIAVIFIIDYLDNTVKSGNEIKAKFDVPVLAEIPDIFMDSKGGVGKYGKYSK